MSSTHESRAQRPERKSEVELKNTIIHEKKTHFQFGMNRRMTARHGAARRSAAGNGMAGIQEATQMVTSYFDPATKLIYAIGAVIGLIGGVRVYQKFSSGDPDTSKTAASWFGACIFLIVAATILRSFFL